MRAMRARNDRRRRQTIYSSARRDHPVESEICEVPHLFCKTPRPACRPALPAPSALVAGVPAVAGAQVLTTDDVCGKTADVRGITTENLPDIEATNALVMGKDGTVYYGRGADEQVKIASITKS